MGKWAADEILDKALQTIAEADMMVAMTGQPASYAEAFGGNLAGVAMTPADFAVGAGIGAGRRIAIASRNDVPVTASGVADHIALIDTLNGRLLYVTTCPSQPLAAGGSASFDGWSVEIGAPV